MGKQILWKALIQIVTSKSPTSTMQSSECIVQSRHFEGCRYSANCHPFQLTTCSRLNLQASLAVALNEALSTKSDKLCLEEVTMQRLVKLVRNR